MMIERSRIIYLATHNPHKVQEISSIVGSSWQLRTLAEVSPPVSWEETGSTFLENAMIKAQQVRAATGSLVLAEDSGLCVDILQGAPGVISSSYGGVEGDHQRNCAKLLADLKGVPAHQRRAHYICTLVYVNEAGEFTSFVGRCHGEITEAPRGSNGFGYDPIFQPLGLSKTMAELSSEEKSRISHRQKALSAWQKHMNSNP